MSDRTRLAIVVSHPIQYYSPWFRHLAASGLTVRVYYLWDFGVTHQRDPGFGATFAWDVDLLSGYEHEFVPNISLRPGTDHFSGLNNPTLTARLKAWNPGAILVFGYKYRTHVSLIAWAGRQRIPLLFRGDSHLLGRTNLGVIKQWALRLLYSRFAAFLYVGRANRAYFESFRVPAQKLFFAPHCVNAAHFQTGDGHREAACALRHELGLHDRRVVLFAGKLVPAKQPLPLMEAFLKVAGSGHALVYVGDGPEKAALHQLAAARPDACIRFLPFANQSEMPSRFLLADVFALPSIGLYETWGLAVNEAMHMGVPCLVTDRVGCQQDLVTDGETGWFAPAGDQPALERKLAEALRAIAADRERWRAAAMSRVSGYSYEAATAGLRKALISVTECRR
jgi:glycosyltransferase involved in cell wall biosynthesis